MALGQVGHWWLGLEQGVCHEVEVERLGPGLLRRRRQV